VLERYAAARDASQRWPLSYDLLLRVKRWLARHGGLDVLSGKLGTLGRELEDEVLVEWRQGRYWEDLATQEKGREGAFPHLRESGTVTAKEAAALAIGDAPLDAPKTGSDRYARSIVQGHELTDAEIAALRIYTSPDYAYINAAMAADDRWLRAVLAGAMYADLYGSHPAGAADLKQAVHEGRRHARIAEWALTKLDIWGPGETWRGEMWDSAAEVQRRYAQGTKLRLVHFLSMSKKQERAVHFAKGARPQHVVMHLRLTDATDVELLSVIRSEAEVLLAPGAELEITSLKPLQLSGAQWWEVEAKQTDVAPSQRR